MAKRVPGGLTGGLPTKPGADEAESPSAPEPAKLQPAPRKGRPLDGEKLPTSPAAANLQQTFGRNFKAKRLAAGMTQAQVAALTGMYRQDVTAIEKGSGNVTLRTMHRLALAVDCQVEVLLTPSEIPSTG